MSGAMDAVRLVVALIALAGAALTFILLRPARPAAPSPTRKVVA